MRIEKLLLGPTRATACIKSIGLGLPGTSYALKIAYLILAHANPKHFERLIGSLQSPNARFFIHVDRKADIQAFAHPAREDVTFCHERVDCAWGNISLVDATLNVARMALEHPGGFERFVLLSGACYPIKSTRYIEDFFASHADIEFIEAIPMPNVEFGKPMERLTRYFITREAPFAHYKWKLQSFLHRVLPTRDYRSAFGDLQPVAGSQWWALTRDALAHACRMMVERPTLYRFCKHVDCPDELLFQTALWNSPFRARIAHSLTFTHWLPTKMGPELIDERFIDRFRAARVLDSEMNNSPHEKGEVLFARKFTDASTAAVEAIEQIRRSGVDASQPDRARAGERST